MARTVQFGDATQRDSLAVKPLHRSGALFELRRSFSSKVTAISPAVDQLMRFFATFRNADGSEADVEIALHETITNAVIQGNKEDPSGAFMLRATATLSRWKIVNPRAIHYRRQSDFWKPHWYLPKMEPFQERLGGRVALAAKIDIAGVLVASYNLRLESRGNDDLRIAQLEDALRDALACDAFVLPCDTGELFAMPPEIS